MAKIRIRKNRRRRRGMLANEQDDGTILIAKKLKPTLDLDPVRSSYSISSKSDSFTRDTTFVLSARSGLFISEDDMEHGIFSNDPMYEFNKSYTVNANKDDFT